MLTESLVTNIYFDIKKKIEEIEFKPGERISEAKLAEIYNVSRTPIKQALGRLEVDGIVYVRPSIGTFVAPIDTERLHEFFTLRKLLELSILEEFKGKQHEDAVQQLIDNLDQQDLLVQQYCVKNKVDASKEFWHLDNQFHRIIFRAVDKEFLWDYILSNSIQANRFRVLSVSVHSENLKSKVDEHHLLYNYLINDTHLDLEEYYNQHLFSTIENYVNELREAYPNYFI